MGTEDSATPESVSQSKSTPLLSSSAIQSSAESFSKAFSPQAPIV